MFYTFYILLKPVYFQKMDTLIFNRMKHSNVIYNAITRTTLIDNSLKKDLEIANNRRSILRKIKDKETNKSFEMSESHDAKPYCTKSK